MTITLRPARDLDAGQMGAMITDAVAARAWKPLLHTAAEDIAHCAGMIARGWITVAETDAGVVGFLALDGEAVNALFVTPKAQGQGVGTALLRDAMARSPRLELWTFLANDGARRFYSRHGFTEVERGDGSANEEGLPDIKFAWTAGDTR